MSEKPLPQDVYAHPPKRWELDRRVQLPALLALIGWAFLGIWWLSAVENRTVTNSTRIAQLERQQEAQASRVADLVTGLAQAIVRLDNVNEGLRRIEALLERVLYGAPNPG